LNNKQHELAAERAKLVTLIASRAPETLDRYADLRSRSRTQSAHDLVWRLYWDIVGHEQKTGSRVRKRRSRTGVKFTEALERLVGDLLRARTGSAGTSRIYQPMGSRDFMDAPVKYDLFMRVLDGLKGLGLVEHRRGRTRYAETGFDFRATLPGHAARFWATPKLLKLAEEYGINSDKADEHFFPEPPTNPLVLKDFATGKGQNKEKGRRIKYKHTPETEKLEADVKELNEFLARMKLTGGRHEGYVRSFNNAAWDKGGRLSSVGQGNYQQLSEPERLKMKINGEPVAEIDIKASHLTIYHAMVGEPLDGRSDPYARVVGVGIDRDVAKSWCIESFGNSSPKTRWSSDATKKSREKGQVLPKARTVRKAMLEVFPALRKLEQFPHLYPHIWADLQYKEAEAVIGTMLVLMRRHEVPSLSMHDGLVVPRSKADLAKDILVREYRRQVGVEPMLTVDMDTSVFADWDF
jgi:hypothetical protein